MIRNICNLPNYCRGKVYKRWDTVIPVFSDGILATKTRKDGSSVQLLITDNGKIRELHSPKGKILDETDSDGFVKRTYVYENRENYTVGHMFASAAHILLEPLVKKAVWITKNTIPQRVKLHLNPFHKGANIFIVGQRDKNGRPFILGNGQMMKIHNVTAKDFEDVTNPLPKTMIFRTDKNESRKIEAPSGEANFMYASHFGITSRDDFGQNIRIGI